MSHTAIPAADQVTIQSGAVVSKVIYHDGELEVTVFGFDAGRDSASTRPAVSRWSKSSQGGCGSPSTARNLMPGRDSGSTCCQARLMRSWPPSPL